MCDIVNMDFPGDDVDGFITEGNAELTILIEEEDDIWINPSVLRLGGKVLCKHPDTDWHKMEIEPGESLHCPKETQLKMILPFPYNKDDSRFKDI